MSRFELNEYDRARVQRAREELAAAETLNLLDERAMARTIGRLEVALQQLVELVDEADAQLSVDCAFPKVAEFLAEERERPVDPEVLAWHQGAIEGDPAVCGVEQPGQPAFPCIWNRSAHVDHRDLLGRTWRGGERP